MMKRSFYKYKLSFPGVKDIIMVSLCLYSVPDVPLCVCVFLYCCHCIGLFASEEDLSVIYVCASSAIVHDGHVWLDKRHTHMLVKEHHSSF